MRLLVQRVVRASAEVDSCIESRIGPGLLLTLSFTAGDSELVARQLAAKVLALNLWPELLNPDGHWKTNVVDNGYEVLVMLQPSLCATFPKNVPNEERVLGLEAAKPIMEAFVDKLKEGYQEEMVVLAPLDAPSIRLEAVSEGSSAFVLGAGDGKAAAAGKPGAAQPAPAKPQPLKPELSIVTKALSNIRYMAKAKAATESERAFQAMGVASFQAQLADAEQEQSDAFAGALDAAGRAFTPKQREQITIWTGLQFSDELAEEAELDEAAEAAAKAFPDDDEPLDDLGAQLAELRGEVQDRSKGIAAAKRRRDPFASEAKPDEEKDDTVRRNPDWTGRAAPETPAMIAARQWALNRNAKGKGKGTKGPRYVGGIATLNAVDALHGNTRPAYPWAQSTKFSDQKMHFSQAKDEEGSAAKRRAVPQQPARLPKGTPTVAPMCPAGADDADDDDDI